jgi:hypothetical protein
MENAPAHKNLLASKLAKILGEVGKVPKSGHNSFHNYDYVTENDLVYAVRAKLAEAGVFVFSSNESQHVEVCEDKEGKKFFLTTVTTKHTFVDGESGESFSVLSQGQGSDNGDKGGYKAMTGAMKYFLYKCFMIPTGDDPEQDTKTDERGAPERKTTAATSSAPKNPPASEPRREPEVPRDEKAPITEAMVDKYRDGKWAARVVHWGKNKGVKLGDLSPNAVAWYATDWQIKPYRGKWGADDLELLAAATAGADEV